MSCPVIGCKLQRSHGRPFCLPHDTEFLSSAYGHRHMTMTADWLNLRNNENANATTPAVPTAGDGRVITDK